MSSKPTKIKKRSYLRKEALMPLLNFSMPKSKLLGHSSEVSEILISSCTG